MSGILGWGRWGRDAALAAHRRWQDGDDDTAADPALAPAAAPFAALAAAPAPGPGPGPGGGGGGLPGPTFLNIVTTPQTRLEGASPSVGSMFFTVTRSGDTSGSTTVNWSVGSFGANAASAADLAGNVLPSGALSFAPGVTTRTITVEVTGDAVAEADEAFSVTLSGAAGTNPGGTLVVNGAGTGVIVNDDANFSIASLNASAVNEGTAITGSTAFSFTVSRTGLIGGTDTVSYEVMGFPLVGTDMASANDFTAPNGSSPVFPSGTLTFTGTETTRTISIPVKRDAFGEANESFIVVLSSPTGGPTIHQGTALATISDDDSISGTAGNDTLVGTAYDPEETEFSFFTDPSGVDVFLIGSGLDSITALTGTDRFYFLPSALGAAAVNTATLQDFSRAAGETLDLSRIDAVTGGFSFGNEAFTFIGTSTFGGVAGQLRWSGQPTHRLIQGDVNGDSVADLTIKVMGGGTVDSSWFVL